MMNIEMPGHDEKERNIRSILDAALPVKRSLHGEIKRLLHAVGLNYAFYGVRDGVAAAFMISFGVILTVSFMINVNPAYFFIPVLFFAPILYFSILAFTSWKEHMTGTWEVLAACRYNLKYVTAIRVMMASAAGMIFLPVATLPLMFRTEYPNIIATAFCAMFLYSTLTLRLLLVSELPVLRFAAPVIWIAGWGLLLALCTPFQVEHVIVHTPLAVSGLLACALLVLYLAELRVFIMRTTRRFALT